MYQLSIENEKGQKLELTNRSDFYITSIDGLEPPNATINHSTVANYDGSTYNSAHIDNRDITIYLKVNTDCEKVRNLIYKYAIVKKKLKIYFVNGIRNVYIEGIVDGLPVEYFVKKQVIAINIKCLEPFWKAKVDLLYEFSNIINNLHFPLELEEAGEPFSILAPVIVANIPNSGDVETGCIFKFRAIGKVINPKLYNLETNDYILLNFTMESRDQIIINTSSKQKSVTLLRNGELTNIFNCVDRSSSWLTLQPGINSLTYVADDDPLSEDENNNNTGKNLIVSMTVNNKYLGV